MDLPNPFGDTAWAIHAAIFVAMSITLIAAFAAAVRHTLQQRVEALLEAPAASEPIEAGEAMPDDDDTADFELPEGLRATLERAKTEEAARLARLEEVTAKPPRSRRRLRSGPSDG